MKFNRGKPALKPAQNTPSVAAQRHLCWKMQVYNERLLRAPSLVIPTPPTFKLRCSVRIPTPATPGSQHSGMKITGGSKKKGRGKTERRTTNTENSERNNHYFWMELSLSETVRGEFQSQGLRRRKELERKTV